MNGRGSCLQLEYYSDVTLHIVQAWPLRNFYFTTDSHRHFANPSDLNLLSGLTVLLRTLASSYNDFASASSCKSVRL